MQPIPIYVIIEERGTNNVSSDYELMYSRRDKSDYNSVMDKTEKIAQNSFTFLMRLKRSNDN